MLPQTCLGCRLLCFTHCATAPGHGRKALSAVELASGTALSSVEFIIAGQRSSTSLPDGSRRGTGNPANSVRASIESGLFHGRAFDQFLDLADGSETSRRLSVTVRQERHEGVRRYRLV